MTEQQPTQQSTRVNLIPLEDISAVPGVLPPLPHADLYSKHELIVTLHDLLVDLQNNADLMLRSEDPSLTLYQRLSTAVSAFFFQNSLLPTENAEAQRSLEEDPSQTLLLSRLRILRDNCSMESSAIGQVEHKTIAATLAVVRAIATDCFDDFANMRLGYTSESKEHFATIAKENLLRQIRHGFGSTLLHTGSISVGNALLASESDFFSIERAQKIVSVLNYLSQMKYDPSEGGGLIFSRRGFYDKFSLSRETDEASFEKLKDFFHERYRALQPQAIALLEALIVARTRHLLTRTDLYLTNRDFAAAVNTTDPIDLFKTHLDRFPQLNRIRPDVACCGDFTGRGYTLELQHSLSSCFVKWGVDRKDRQCNDFIDVVNIVRGDWPRSRSHFKNTLS